MKPEIVTLTFAFHAGDTATFHSESSKVTTVSGAPTREVRSVADTTWDVRQAGDGWGVREVMGTEAGTILVDGVEQPPDPLLDEMAKVIGPIPTDRWIATDGAWKGIVDEAVVRHAIDEAVGGYFDGLLARIADPDARAVADGRLAPFRRMLSADAIFAKESADWAWHVAYWSGASLQVGEVYSGTQELGSPALGMGPTTWLTSFSVVDVKPCRKGRHAPQCAVLDVTFAPQDPRAFGDAVRVGLGVKAPPETVVEAETITRRHGLVEIGTLRPWAWTVDTHVHTTTTLPGEAPVVYDDVEHVERTWVWSP